MPIVTAALGALDAGPSRVEISGSIGIGVTAGRRSSDSLEGSIIVDINDTGCIIVADSRICYKDDLKKRLKLNDSRECSSIELILDSYKKWGKNCLQYLHGEFSFAIWDPVKECVFCARDHFGCKPVYFVDGSNWFAISSNPVSFKALPGFVLRIRDQFILDAICSVSNPQDESAFADVSRLKPASYFTYSIDKLLSIKRYWDLKINEKYLSLNEVDATLELKERIFDAIIQRCDSGTQIGVELSGGLDSSGIASVLAKVCKGSSSLHAYTHSKSNFLEKLSPTSIDEGVYSKLITEDLNIDKHVLISGKNSPGSYSALILALRAFQRPVNESFAVNSDLLLKEAQDAGVEILFSGFGGDEGISNSGEGFYEELIHLGEHKILKKNLAQKVNRHGGNFNRQLLKLYLSYYSFGLFDFFKKDWRKKRFLSFAIDNKLWRDYSMKERFFKSTLLPSDPDVRVRQYNQIMQSYISQRLEESNVLAGKFGVEYRYPFFDVKLLEFYYSLPSDYKYSGGYGRSIFRKAMKGIVTEKVRLRADKAGATIPYVFDRVLKDEDKFREIIEEGRENNRFHYVDYNKLHNMLDIFRDVKDIKQLYFGPRAFLTPMSVLILQKWQREGKIDIGIKC